VMFVLCLCVGIVVSCRSYCCEAVVVARRIFIAYVVVVVAVLLIVRLAFLFSSLSCCPTISSDIQA
jgi:hypothetical protein